MDLSVKVATGLAGLLDGIIVDETLEAEAPSHVMAGAIRQAIQIPRTGVFCRDLHKPVW
jgi:hypothetical protein